jgi:protocatechuate 3,4-dioxygenase, alpha subunit
MSAITTRQTIGPFFHEGMKWAFAPRVAHSAVITLSGAVLDANSAPVTDAMIEAWQPSAALHASDRLGACRVATDRVGRFTISLAATTIAGPFAFICVFARGMLNHQFSAVFLSDASDMMLDQVPAARRSTLIAQKISDTEYAWDVHLQGANETVFFDYE